MPHIWVRAETKHQEHRTALTPNTARQLVAKGFKVSVERCTERIFKDEDYEGTGVTMVPHGSWRTAPADAYILGLKELPENDDSPLPHQHIMFAHCYKGQAGWKEVLNRFDAGKGTLLDLEFLVDDRGRRVAAFGYHAGYAGSAVGLDVWCHKILKGDGVKFPQINHFNNDKALIAYIKENLALAVKKFGRQPRVMVMGALGRCGSGATDFVRHAGIPEENIIKWDMAETKAGGPFPEILAADIFVNCIYLSTPIPPFITLDMVKQTVDRKLSVLVDVSCDATNPHNPIPVYYGATTFVDPVLRVAGAPAADLDVIAIDHLPSLLSRESSEAFCTDLLPSLFALADRQASPVWSKAEKLFHDKVAESKTSKV
ncbi:Formate/glycerate dehydrogenase catalytic domain-like protein [Rhizoclosmatium globosum]|uniref:Saccharopine dehydrogenase [NAD(+), L-lysine-forming] n=1 Tax=Rhizoclosmatium globosum TaxID=329046 RepID=A0A1Y2CNR2_9FUNG|nr:Formate/glycerate dehydrogenase catalytic domain-like protein [Rhizoclosmatium globosum]|eukprot:ORY48484.1 Formate/glycerate dehydrogenase catalytic domain-like protein [Rhizoclosmatium globosum]